MPLDRDPSEKEVARASTQRPRSELEPLDAKTLYWTAAWANMVAVLILASAGIRQIPRARYERHKALMLTACGLVVFFVLSYALKLGVLGREALQTWQPRYVYVLRLHEVCVLVMLVGGGVGLWQAHRLGLPVTSSSDPTSAQALGPGIGADALASGLRLHRRAGFVALAGALCGVVTAAYVLFGMYMRL